MKIRSRTLTAARLRELIEYDEQTGLFRWRERFGTRKLGWFPGTIETGGYNQVYVDGERHQAHRLAWLWMTGEWPDSEIDHIDRDKQNNCWRNLRVATRAENQANIGAHRRSKLGVKGVQLIGHRYKAKIHIKGQTVHLGSFATVEAAAAAYEAAALKLWGEFALQPVAR